MDRRDFLKTLLGLGVSLTLPFDIQTADAKEIDRYFEEFGGYTFYVEDGGYLYIDDYYLPETRFEGYQLTDDIDQYTEEMIYEIRDITRITFYDLFIAHQANLKKELLGASKVRALEIEKLLKAYKETENYDELELWIKYEPETALRQLSNYTNDWLGEKPDDGDYEYFGPRYGPYKFPFEFFEYGLVTDDGVDVINALGLEFVDGECPGNDFRGVKLTKNIEEANQILKELKLDFRFSA